MILSDAEITQEVLYRHMISPFEKKLVTKGISYGLSSYGYDARFANEVKWFEPTGTLDPLEPLSYVEDYRHASFDEAFVIPAHGFVLGRTVEYFKIPRNILAICIGKSTYARLGLVVNVTPLEPGWEGHVTLELSNTTNFPLKIYANQGICQFVFFRGTNCINSYKDRKGKYDKQVGVTLPRALKK